jgi:hypothetical protein
MGEHRFVPPTFRTGGFLKIMKLASEGTQKGHEEAAVADRRGLGNNHPVTGIQNLPKPCPCLIIGLPDCAHMFFPKSWLVPFQRGGRASANCLADRTVQETRAADSGRVQNLSRKPLHGGGRAVLSQDYFARHVKRLHLLDI